MSIIKKMTVIGGDSRQRYMAMRLSELGFEVVAHSLSGSEISDGITYAEQGEILNIISTCDAVVLPLPVTNDCKTVNSVAPVKATLKEIAGAMHEGQAVFAGMIGASVRKKFTVHGAEVYDYFDREEVKIMNTVPTAQGILKTVIENIDYTLSGCRCAVTGYGRVGRAAADMLKALNADVTVCARKFSDVAWAQTCGMKAVDFDGFQHCAGELDVIVNTVPSPVITREILEKLARHCLIIDVASAPFGTDFACADELGIKAIQCPSLPGKVAPKTAGRIIADGIANIVKEAAYG